LVQICGALSTLEGADASEGVSDVVDLLAPLAASFQGDGWWGILLFIPLLLAGHVSEGAVVYGLWQRSARWPPAPRVWRVAAISGAVAAVFLVATLIWVAVYVAPRLAADLAHWLL
jgi:hypothetical protein